MGTFDVESTVGNQLAASDRLARQISFILEIDKAKNVLRRSRILDESRRENDAEHSWHLAMMALLLSEYANEPVDVCKVIKMTLVHDIVEIDAGDTFAYDGPSHDDKEEREQKAADRIFGLLPEDQRDEMRSLWMEFEKRETPEAKFAAALDRLQPMMLNFFTKGSTWREYDIPKDRVKSFNEHMTHGSAQLWEYAKGLIDLAAQRGYLRP